MLRIAVLGAFGLWIDGREVRLRSNRAQALLGYLVLTEGHRASRESLAGMFWGATPDNRARNSLRQIVKELRAAQAEQGFGAIALDGPVLAIDRQGVQSDVWEIADAAAAGRAHPLLLRETRLTERLLEGLDGVDEVFRNWLLPRRQGLHNRLVRDLETALRDAATARVVRHDLGAALLNLDPTHEEACRAVMRLRAEDGDGAGAQRRYDALARVLADEFDTDPAEETTALYAKVKAGAFDARPPAGDPVFATALRNAMVAQRIDPPGVGEHRAKLVVLVEAFGKNGIAPDQSHLVEGFRHSLLASLVRFREWHVADGSARRAGPVVLGPTSYVIEATAYQAGSAISLVLTLRELDANVYVWSEGFELKLDNWLAAQQRIVRRVAMSLNVHLSAERLMRLEGRPDVALDIHDRWLRGQALARRFGADNWNRAARIYEETIRDAPGFSPAYSSLAQMNNVVHMAHPGLRREMARAESTLALARRAVTLDPLDSRAQLALGWALAMMDRPGQAATPMLLASELNPYDSWTQISAALFHAYSGDAARARALADDSMQLTQTPTLLQWGYDGTIRFIEGDYRGAVDATEQAQDVIPTLPGWRAAALHHLGDRRGAAREGRRFVELIRGRWQGAAPASDGAIGNWLLHQYPLARRSDWERLREGIEGAGVAVDPIAFQVWWD